MGQEVVTTLTIDAETGGAEQFSQAMDRSADSAQKGVRSAQDYALAVAGLGVGVAASFTGIIDYVVGANKELAQLAAMANRVDLSLTDLQAIRFGGQIAGMSVEQINAGLERSASLLNDASRNSNSLSKELDANGISIRQANGQLLSQNQLLGIAADLVRKAATPQDQIVIAQMLGFTKEWIPLLQQGAGAMAGLGDEARRAGALISDETIDKADVFDVKWRKSSIEWQYYMKAALSEMLPVIDDLIDRASRFIEEVRKRGGDTPGAIAKTAADSVLKSVGVDPQRGLFVDADGLVQAEREFRNSPIFSVETWRSFGEALAGAIHLQITREEASAKVAGFAASQIVEPSYPTAAQMDAAFDRVNPPDPGSRLHPLAGLTAADYSDEASKVASRDQVNDAVDRAINALRRHTAAQEADALAVGFGDAALARFRAEAQETAAIQANGGKITAEQAAQFELLKVQAYDAADALARAKLASQVSFDRQSAFLSPRDLQIAQQLRKLYGDDIPAALSSAEAAQLRFNYTLKDMSNLGQDVNRGLFVEFGQNIRNGASAMEAFEKAGLSALNKIADKLMQMAADNLWSSAFGGGSGGGFSLGSLFGVGGGGAGSGSVPTWSGTDLGAGTGGLSIPMFADGTDSAPGGWAVVGERGPELMRVPKGSEILPNGRMPSNDNGGGASKVHVDVGVSVDNDGNLQAYVKNVSQAAAAQGVASFVSSPQFVDHVGAASGKARSRRL